MTKKALPRSHRYIRKTVSFKGPSRVTINQLLPLQEPPSLGIILRTDELMVPVRPRPRPRPGGLAVLHDVVPSRAVVLLL